MRRKFQSTRPRGARRSRISSKTKPSSFNPRAREGRDDAPSCVVSVCPSFNPRAREGRDARDAYGDEPCLSFNPRAREGRDTGEVLRHGVLDVSIHAPARGATGGPSLRVQFEQVSIHAPARGATVSSVRRNSPRFLFQSTRPRGARLRDHQAASRIRCFNPRAREGRDKVACAFKLPVDVSIHAPARGAT